MIAFLSKSFALFTIFAATMLGVSESQGTGVNETENSHLTCFPAMNPAGKFKALINLEANKYQQAYNLKQCKVLWKRVDLCIPSTKEVRKFASDSEPVGDLLPRDSTIYNDFLCYTMKCSKDNILPESQFVVGQFGKHYLKFNQNYSRFKVCIPAWKLNDAGEPIILEY